MISVIAFAMIITSIVVPAFAPAAKADTSATIYAGDYTLKFETLLSPSYRQGASIPTIRGTVKKNGQSVDNGIVKLYFKGGITDYLTFESANILVAEGSVVNGEFVLEVKSSWGDAVFDRTGQYELVYDNVTGGPYPLMKTYVYPKFVYDGSSNREQGKKFIAKGAIYTNVKPYFFPAEGSTITVVFVNPLETATVGTASVLTISEGTISGWDKLTGKFYGTATIPAGAGYIYFLAPASTASVGYYVSSSTTATTTGKYYKSVMYKLPVKLYTANYELNKNSLAHNLAQTVRVKVTDGYGDPVETGTLTYLLEAYDEYGVIKGHVTSSVSMASGGYAEISVPSSLTVDDVSYIRFKLSLLKGGYAYKVYTKDVPLGGTQVGIDISIDQKEIFFGAGENGVHITVSALDGQNHDDIGFCYRVAALDDPAEIGKEEGFSDVVSFCMADADNLTSAEHAHRNSSAATYSSFINLRHAFKSLHPGYRIYVLGYLKDGGTYTVKQLKVFDVYAHDLKVQYLGDYDKQRYDSDITLAWKVTDLDGTPINNATVTLKAGDNSHYRSILLGHEDNENRFFTVKDPTSDTYGDETDTLAMNPTAEPKKFNIVGGVYDFNRWFGKYYSFHAMDVGVIRVYVDDNFIGHYRTKYMKYYHPHGRDHTAYLLIKPKADLEISYSATPSIVPGEYTSITVRVGNLPDKENETNRWDVMIGGDIKGWDAPVNIYPVNTVPDDVVVNWANFFKYYSPATDYDEYKGVFATDRRGDEYTFTDIVLGAGKHVIRVLTKDGKHEGKKYISVDAVTVDVKKDVFTRGMKFDGIKAELTYNGKPYNEASLEWYVVGDKVITSAPDHILLLTEYIGTTDPYWLWVYGVYGSIYQTGSALSVGNEFELNNMKFQGAAVEYREVDLSSACPCCGDNGTIEEKKIYEKAYGAYFVAEKHNVIVGDTTRKAEDPVIQVLTTDGKWVPATATAVVGVAGVPFTLKVKVTEADGTPLAGYIVKVSYGTFNLQGKTDDKGIYSTTVKTNSESFIDIAVTNPAPDKGNIIDDPESELYKFLGKAAIGVDNVPPTVELSNVETGTVIKTADSKFKIEGTVTDNFGVKTVEIVVNGVIQKVVIPVDGKFSAVVELNEGLNNIYVRATDLAGNISTTDVIQVLFEDTEAPVITITKPEDYTKVHVVTEPDFEIAGKVTDNVGVKNVVVLLDGAPVTVANVINGYFMAKVQLHTGTNTIKVVAYDVNGNSSYVDITVVYNKPEDTTAPTLEITFPKIPEGQLVYETDQPEITVQGTVSDDMSGVKAVLVNGEQVEVIGGTFSYTVKLNEGANVINVMAVDYAGHVAKKSITVVYDPYLNKLVIELAAGSQFYKVNGETKVMDVAPFINSDGRTMVPVRFIAEAMGLKVKWDGEKRQVLISGENKEIVLTIDSNIAMVDGTPVKMDTKAVIVNSRTFVPLRFVAEAFGFQVEWIPPVTVRLIKQK